MVSKQRLQDFLEGRIPREDPDFNRCQQYLTNQPKPKYI